MILTRNSRGDFVLRDPDDEGRRQAKAAGFIWSRTGGVFYTREPYAAYAFVDHADDKAAVELEPLRWDYDASYAEEYHGSPLREPPNLELMPFQRAGVAYALERRNALIGDQPGLGKTAQAIVFCNEVRAKRVLVVCPAAVRLHWRKEALAWSTLTRPYPYPVLKSTDGVSPSAEFVIVSYDLLARSEPVMSAVMSYKWDVLILDEAHYLKTPEALRTRSVFGSLGPVAGQCERILGLTGTPLPNRPRECYTLARGLCWDAIDWMSEDAFRNRFNPSMRMPSGHVWEKTGRLPELRARLRCNFMVRRMKAQVLKQLPAKTYELTYVEATGGVGRVLRQEQELIDRHGGVDKLLETLRSDMTLEGSISTLRREMAEEMAPRVAEHVSMLLDGGLEKVVVWAHHRSVMDLLEEKLARYGSLRVDGAVSPTQRHMRVEAFQKDPKKRVFLGQLQAAGTGVDGLQNAASWCVFAEASWTPGENEQCLDRLHRHGQRDGVMAQFMVAEGSLSERILSRAIEKARDAKEALDG